MKNLSLLALIVLMSVVSYATHIVGGDLHYEHLGGDNYAIVLKVYRDCGTSATGFDDPAAIGVFNNGVLVQTVEITLAEATTTFLPIDTGDPCLEPPSGLCVAEAIYYKEVEIPYQTGGFILAYQRCCRNTTLVNCESNDDIGITLTAEIPDKEIYGDNSNPSFVNFPPVVICLNQTFQFDHSATDLDGDSLVYEFCNPLLTNVAGFYINPPGNPPYPELQFYPEYDFEYPIDADPAFTIDEDNGFLTGFPNSPGQYVVGICVKEFRDGQLISSTNRDFQFNIVSCSQGIYAAMDEIDPCIGLDIQFGNNSTGDEFFWDFGVDEIETDTSDVINPEYTFPDSGSYEIMLVSNPGWSCADTTIQVIQVYEPIEAMIELQDDFCEAGSRIIDFTGIGDFTDDAIFIWSFEGGDPAISTDFDPGPVEFNTQGTYNVIFTVEDHSCIDTFVQEIVIDPLPVAAIAQQTEFCGGLTVDFMSLSQFASTYLWDFGDSGTGDVSNEENPSWTYSGYGTFTVTLIVDAGTDCEHSITTEVTVLPPDPIDLVYTISPPLPCDSSVVIDMEFTGSGADDITWDMGDGTILEGSPVQYTYDEEGAYIITINAFQDLCDFEESAEEEIYYNFSVIDLPVIIPNVFTPNNDGKNERFRIYYLGENDMDDLFPPDRDIFDYMSDYSMKIYDRWGVLLFDTVSGFNSWDGTYNGNDIAEGTYFFILEYRRLCIDSEVTTETGHFTILR
jgi:gliding motility-associated-like protein